MLSLPVLTQILVNGLSLSAIYVLIALGFTLLFGIMKVVNFAHGSFAMLGGYALFYYFGKLALPYGIAIVAAALSVATLGLLLEWLVYRRFYQKMFQSMIGLLGLDIAIVYTAVLVWDVHERSIPAALGAMVRLGPATVPADRLMVICVAIVVLLAFWALMRNSRYGLAMRASAEDIEIAEAQGVNTRRIYQLAFFLAVFMTAIAGAIYAQTYALSPFMGERPLMVAFIVVILGGMGSIPGAALGGTLFGFAESALSTLYGSAVSTFISFAVVIGLLVVRPWGLLGKPDR